MWSQAIITTFHAAVALLFELYGWKWLTEKNKASILYFNYTSAVSKCKKILQYIFNMEHRLTVLWDIKSIYIIFYLQISYISFNKTNAYSLKMNKESVKLAITWVVNNILIGLECWSLIFWGLAFIYWSIWHIYLSSDLYKSIPFSQYRIHVWFYIANPIWGTSQVREALLLLEKPSI